MSTDPATLLSEPDLTGKEIGDFTIIYRIGRGGMADVYLAEQTSLQRKVAFKVLHQRLASDPNYVKRFKNEAQAAAALTHPNIVQIFEVGTIDEFHYIAQEYVDGENLKQYLTRKGSASAFLTVTTIRQVAAALHKATESRVIHRDIKPENVMITIEGVVKVADFGLARIKRPKEKNQALTQVGMTLGTPLYMSPEQAEGGQVDHRSDIYSLGVTAYHMLAGRPPFEKETALATAIAHKTETARSLHLFRPELPLELVTIIEKMMEKNPDERYMDCGGIIKDLLHVTLDSSEEEWSAAFSSLSPAEASALYSSHLAATQKLDRVIHGKSRISMWALVSVLIVGVTFGSYFLGNVVGGMNPPPPILDSTAMDLENFIPKKTSVIRQYEYAVAYSDADHVKKLEAFRAVQKYFPASEGADRNVRYRMYLRAEVEIGFLQLRNDSLDAAQTTFENILKQADPVKFSVQYLQAQAGLVIIHSQRQEFDKIAEYQADVLLEIDVLEPELGNELRQIFAGLDKGN